MQIGKFLTESCKTNKQTSTIAQVYSCGVASLKGNISCALNKVY